MSKLKIHLQGDEILKKRAQEVGDISNSDFQEFIDELIVACYKYEGVGIAAPQVGVSKRLFIMAAKPNPRYPDAPQMEAEAVINPEILSQSTELHSDYEGCLSVPGYRGMVPRPIVIQVRYMNRKGEEIEAELQDFMARLFLHENDHLDGVLFPNRMDPDQELITSEEYFKLLDDSK